MREVRRRGLAEPGTVFGGEVDCTVEGADPVGVGGVVVRVGDCYGVEGALGVDLGRGGKRVGVSVKMEIGVDGAIV